MAGELAVLSRATIFNMWEKVNNLYQRLSDNVRNFPERTALYVEGKAYSYLELELLAGKVMFFLDQSEENSVGILASRSLTGYLGIWSSLKAGKTYIPINTTLPYSKVKKNIELLNLKTLIVDNNNILKIEYLLKESSRTFLLIFPETSRYKIPLDIIENHRIISSEDLNRLELKAGATKTYSNNDFVYILFTSGSTGEPKGVPISDANIIAYIKNFTKRLMVFPDDRFAQSAEIFFDLSVHDIFLAWTHGATLFCIPQHSLISPGQFLTEHNISMWCSVPSIIRIMGQMKLLNSGIFPNIRYSLFCGEALPLNSVEEWKRAAPNSIIENTYGPTEATVNITSYRIPEKIETIQSKGTIVAIGKIFPDQQYKLINEENEIVENEGELCLAGSQVITGYLNDYEKSGSSFIKLKGSDKLWYKTGDIVCQEDNLLYFLSRKDHQVKLNGHRIELGEIDVILSKVFSAEKVVSLPVRNKAGIVQGIVSFLEGANEIDSQDRRTKLRKFLPDYMIPRELIFISKIPLNANGKTDLAELKKLIK